MRVCRDHHVVLRHLLEDFPTALPIDESEVLQKLQRLSTMLLRHLKFEDDVLYPALEHGDDRTLRRMARHYSEEMGGLKNGFVQFTERWRSAGCISSDPDGFLRDWADFRKALTVRMSKEDDGLYAIAFDMLRAKERSQPRAAGSSSFLA